MWFPIYQNLEDVTLFFRFWVVGTCLHLKGKKFEPADNFKTLQYPIFVKKRHLEKGFQVFVKKNYLKIESYYFKGLSPDPQKMCYLLKATEMRFLNRNSIFPTTHF